MPVLFPNVKQCRYRSIDAVSYEGETVFDVNILRGIVDNCRRFAYGVDHYKPGTIKDKFANFRKAVYHIISKGKFDWVISCRYIMDNVFDTPTPKISDIKIMNNQLYGLQLYQCDSLGEFVILFGKGSAEESHDKYALLFADQIATNWQGNILSNK